MAASSRAVRTKRSRWLLIALVVGTPVIAFWISQAMDARGANPDVVVGILSRITFTQLTSVALGSFVALCDPWLLQPSKLTGQRIPRLAILGLLLTIAAWLLGWQAIQERILWLGNGNVQYLQAIEPSRIHLWGAGIAIFRNGLEQPGLAKELAVRRTHQLRTVSLSPSIYAWFGLATFGKSDYWLTALCAVVATFLVAALSFHFLNSHAFAGGNSRRRGRNTSVTVFAAWDSRPVVGLLLLFIAVLVVNCNSPPLSHLLNLSAKIPVEQRRYSSRRLYSHICLSLDGRRSLLRYSRLPWHNAHTPTPG